MRLVVKEKLAHLEPENSQLSGYKWTEPLPPWIKEAESKEKYCSTSNTSLSQKD